MFSGELSLFRTWALVPPTAMPFNVRSSPRPETFSPELSGGLRFCNAEMLILQNICATMVRTYLDQRERAR